MLLDILLVAIILVCTALVICILLQRSEGGALGMSGGGPGAFMTARGTGDLLSSTTQVLAAIFFTLCLIMTLVSGYERAAANSIGRLKLKVDPRTLNQLAAPAQPVQSAPSAPTAPPAGAPALPGGGAPNPLNPFGGPAPATSAKPLALGAQPAAAPKFEASAPVAVKPEAPTAPAPTPNKPADASH
jgi:preprotein translocase subunit SecG